MKDFEYKIRTDLAVQNKNLKKISDYKYKGLFIKRFFDDKYNFTNIQFNNIEINMNQELLKQVLIRELKKYLKKYNIKNNSKILVVGLGNKDIISDSLGVKAISYVKSTPAIKNITNSNIPDIYTFIPGVFNDTGLMAYKSIKALTKELKINLVIIIDSLISDSVDYLNKLVQISDKGITPGSGICNYQDEISFKTLKIPVIILGVPTAIEASTIIKDVLKVKDNKISYKEGYDLLVSKKDIDIFINIMSRILGISINKAIN